MTSSMPGRRLLAATTLALLALSTTTAGTATAQDAQDTTYEQGQVIEPGEPTPFVAATADLPSLDEVDPIRFSHDDAIVEFAQVTTSTGTPAGTGTGASPTDATIWVDIIRPDTDEPVPTILISSPYYNTLGRGWRGEGKIPTDPNTEGLTVHDPVLARGGPAIDVAFPEWYDEYFVPRGYAVALMDLRGTRNSSGCQVYGDRDEVIDTVEVIDFLAEQEWSNGKVGMTGGSYDGTISIGAASEHAISGRVPGALGAIIPIRAIGRWYDYHFFNGVQSSNHQLTPALFTAVLAGEDSSTAGTNDLLYPYTLAERKACIATVGAAVDAGYASPYQDTADPFWTERDFISNAADYDTAVFAIGGLFDWNVKNINAGYLWEAMTGDAPKKLWLANMDHADPSAPTNDDVMPDHFIPFPFRAKFVDATHRWYLQFLKGVEAGALDMPTFEVQRWDGTWDSGDQFPAATTDLALYPTAAGEMVAEADASDGEVSWADGPNSSAPSSVSFVTDEFEQDTRISGEIAFELDLAVSGTDTSVAVKVALLPPGLDDPAAAGSAVQWDVFNEPAVSATYGWARAWYRDSIAPRGISSPTGGGPLAPGEAFELDFGSVTTDLVIPSGYRLGFRFGPTSGEGTPGTVASDLGDTVTMALGASGSRILLPVVADAPAPAPEPAPVPVPVPAPLPVTGGGLALLGLVGVAAAVGLRRR